MFDLQDIFLQQRLGAVFPQFCSRRVFVHLLDRVVFALRASLLWLLLAH